MTYCKTALVASGFRIGPAKRDILKWMKLPSMKLHFSKEERSLVAKGATEKYDESLTQILHLSNSPVSDVLTCFLFFAFRFASSSWIMRNSKSRSESRKSNNINNCPKLNHNSSIFFALVNQALQFITFISRFSIRTPLFESNFTSSLLWGSFFGIHCVAEEKNHRPRYHDISWELTFFSL